MATFACDVSYYQKPVTNAYPHRWLIFRACDGTFRDPNYAKNLRWARKAVKSGRIEGFTVYVVFRPGVDVLDVLRSMTGKPDPRMTVMIDVESWGGQVRGNHSAQITRLAERVADWLGDRRRVLAYANRGDFDNLYPRRPSWLRLVLASYGSVRPTIKGMIGWQYSDGQARYPVPAGYPRSSKPFGRCDHNVFPGLSPEKLAVTLGVGPVVKPKPRPKPHPAPKPAAPVKPVTPKPVKPRKPKRGTTYIVRSGDTLSAIADRKHTTWRKLARLNKLRNADKIYVGQKLRLR